MTREPSSPEVVAAVCYRCRDGQIEFLLVKTKGGKKWTFPKGHVKAREATAPSRAAAREAKEEAGAVGAAEPEALTRYLYPTGSDRGGDRLVSAYLLEVERQTAPAPGEEFREPTWFDPEAAKRRLAEGGREQRYADEHSRVIDEALARLEAVCRRR